MPHRQYQQKKKPYQPNNNSNKTKQNQNKKNNNRKNKHTNKQTKTSQQNKQIKKVRTSTGTTYYGVLTFVLLRILLHYFYDGP